jgi:polygalacturonase
VFSSLVSLFHLFGPEGMEDLAAGKACDGAIPDYRNLTDGDTGSMFTGKYRSAAWHAGESFFISRPGTRIYLAPGAMVHGAIAAEGIDDIHIYGRGILDGSWLLHEADPGEARSGAIWITGGKGIRVEGITVIDAPMWQIVLNYDEDVVVRNINLLGYVVNADGIHVSGTKRALIQGCFVRSCDDLIVAYHYGKTQDITVDNCVFLNDDAHVFLFGLGETEGAHIEKITIKNCHILSQQEAPWEPYRFSGVFKFWAHGGNMIENVQISDIHIDSFRYPDKGCVFQLRTERRFNNENPGEGIRNVHFKNIFIESDNESVSLISASGENSFIENVTFEGIVRAGEMVKSIGELNLNIDGNTRDIQIKGE